MPKKIIDHIEEFVERLIRLIETDVKKGSPQLLQVIEDAKTNYEGYVEDYGLIKLAKKACGTRKRGSNFDALSNFIAQEQQLTPILQRLCDFFSKGTWESGSANTQLLNVITTTLKDYEQEQDMRVRCAIHHSINRRLLIKIHQMQNEAALEILEKKEKDKRYLELQKISRVTENVGDVFISDNDAVAKQAAQNEPADYCFTLKQVDTMWHLIWHDATGQSAKLVITDQLKLTLSKVKDPTTITARQQIAIKKECRRMVIKELDSKVKIQVNVPPNALALGLESTYVINTENQTVTWYDSFGQSQLLDISSNSHLQTLLKEKLNNAATLKQVQVELYRLVKRKPVNEVNQICVQLKMLENNGYTLNIVDNIKEVKPFLLKSGVYFLTKEKGQWALYLRRDKKNERVDEAFLGEGGNSFKGILKGWQYDLHLMSQLPEKPEEYKDSYIFIKNKDVQQLYYVGAKKNEPYKKIKIVDFTLFEGKINAIKNNKDAIKLHLSRENIKEIITANGGHEPIICSAQKEQLRAHLAKINDAMERKRREQVLEAQAVEELRMKEEAKRYPCCKAVDNFSSASAASYPVYTFIVTKADTQWRLYYIDTLNRAVVVNLQECQAAAQLMASWSQAPSGLTLENLLDLAKTLNNFKPSVRVSKGRGLFLQEMLSNKLTDINGSQTPSRAEKAPAKLDLNRYGSVVSFFGAMAPSKTPEAILPFSNDDISPPISRRNNGDNNISGVQMK